MTSRDTTSVTSLEKQPRQHMDQSGQENWNGRRAGVDGGQDYSKSNPDSSWQQYDIPSEMQFVQVGAPSEISTIVRDSLEHCQAVRASLNDQFAKSQFYLDAAIACQAESSQDASHEFVCSGASTTSMSESSRSPSQSTSDRGSTVSAATIDSEQDHPIVVMIGEKTTPDVETAVAVTTKTDMKRRITNFLKSSIRGRIFSLEEAPKPSSIECASCFDVVVYTEAVNLRCQHGYCSPCFSKLVSTAIEHETYFPPKCCLQEIPAKTLKAGLSYEELAAYKLRAKEFAIPLDTRWFCASPNCGKWFDRRRSRSRKDIVTCPYCHVKLCQGCRRLSHAPGEICPQDRDFEATFEMANLHGWRRCYKCQALVELISGCHHITCMCRAEFCYTCSAKWGTCKCTDSDERRRQLELRERQLLNCGGTENGAAPSPYDNAWERQYREERERQLREASERAEMERQRLECERRAAEEALKARQIYLMEVARQQAVKDHYEYLHHVLLDLERIQRCSIWDRQAKELANISKSRSGRIQALTGELQIFRDRQLARSRHQATLALAALNCRRIQALEETAIQHESDTMEYARNIDPSLPIHANYSAALLALQSAQQAEIINLKASFAQEAARLEKATMRPELLPSDRLPLEIVYLELVLKQEKEELEQEVTAVRKKHLAEWKWVSTVKAKRAELLREKRSQLLADGGDVRSPVLGNPGSGVDVAARWANRARVNRVRMCYFGEEIGRAPPARGYPGGSTALRSLAY